MPVEFVKDIIRMEQVVGENSTQALVEGDIIIPDTKPDIAKVLQIDGKINIESMEVVQDKITINGVVSFQILYIAEGEDLTITSMDAATSFNHDIEIQGIKPKMVADMKQDIEHIEYTLTNSRKLNIKAVVNIDGRVTNDIQVESIRDVKGLGDLQILRDKVRNRIRIGRESSQTMVKEDVEIPPEMPSIKEILKSDAKVVVKEKKASDNRIIAQGDVILSILYLCNEESEPIQYTTSMIPFTHFVEVAGAYPGAETDTNIDVQDIYVEARENAAGEGRIISVEMVLNMKASAVETEEKEAIIDVYSPSVHLDLNKKKIEFQEMLAEYTGQSVVKESIQLPDSMPKVNKVLSLSAKPIVTDQSIDNEKVVIEGIMDVNILYVSNDEIQPVQSYQTEMPFRCDMVVEGLSSDSGLDLSLEVDHISFTPIVPDEIEVKFVLNSRGTAMFKTVRDVLVDLKELEPIQGESFNGIIIYFTQPGDTLWTIAKGFNTTIAGVLKYNEDLNQQELHPGTRVLLYKKFSPVN